MAKHKYIETPEILWQLFVDYASEIKENPIKKHVFVGKDGDSAEEKRERPLTMIGFLNYLDDQDIITDATDYFENKDKRYNDYVRIASRIERSIKQDQIEGGMAGIYNPSITQRLNGLTEKTENLNVNKNFDITMDLGEKKPEEGEQR